MAVLALAHKLAGEFGIVTEDWNGFSVLQTAAARVGGLDLGRGESFLRSIDGAASVRAGQGVLHIDRDLQRQHRRLMPRHAKGVIVHIHIADHRDLLSRRGPSRPHRAYQLHAHLSQKLLPPHML